MRQPAPVRHHIRGAWFERMTQTSMVHVPYRGGAPAIADTVAGQTQLMFTVGSQSLEYVKAGKLRLLAVTEAKRSPLLPDVQTVAETLPGFEMAVWYAAYGPAGLPPPTSRGLTPRSAASCSCPKSKSRWRTSSSKWRSRALIELAELTRADAEKWTRIIKQLGIVAE